MIYTTSGMVSVDSFSFLKELYENGQFSQLILHCTQQIESGNLNYLYFGARGKAYFELENYNLAIEDISKAIDLFPKYTAGYLNRSRCYLAINEYQFTIDDIEKAHSFNTGLVSYDLLGLSYSCIGNHSKAVENYTVYLAITPDIQVLRWRAECYFQLGQIKDANKDWEQVLFIEQADEKKLEYFEKINEIENYLINQDIKKIDLSSLAQSLDYWGFSVATNQECSGIYILKFKDEEFYIGQAKNIYRRIKQHKKNFSDIESIYFKYAPQDKLFNEEDATISLFEFSLLRLRNLKQVCFKNIFDGIHQGKWLTNLTYNYLSGRKFDNQALREKYEARFAVLKNKPYFTSMVSFLSAYLKLSIPNYLASEYTYWSISCLPKHLPDDQCLSRININSVPVLSLYANKKNSLSAMLCLSKLVFLSYLKKYKSFDSLFKEIPSLIFDLRDAFDSSEGDEMIIHLEEPDFFVALDNELVLKSIRIFNLRMMNNTGKEVAFRRTISHCLPLSDLLIQVAAS
jgi:hypothetical protein